MKSVDARFKTTGLDTDQCHVARFSGREEMSRPFEFELDLLSETDNLNLDEFAGEPGHLTIHGYAGIRHVHGVIDRFRQVTVSPRGARLSPAGRPYTRYRAVLIPTVGVLRYTRNSRIFQELSTPDIVKEVLQTAHVPADRLHLALKQSYKKRGYCVQYQESDFDFISRLLEEEGIFYFFAHDDDKDVMVLGDAVESVEQTPDVKVLRVSHNDPRQTHQAREEVMYDFQSEAAICSGGAMLRDFGFKDPDMNLEVKKEGQAFKHLASYYYPGEYVEPDLGKRLVEIRLEEQQALRRRYTGVSNCRSLVPGYLLSLDKHRRTDYNQKYLVLSVQQEAIDEESQEGGVTDLVLDDADVKILCIPADVPFRPRRQTPRPSIPGVQTATVCGPKGEEVHCDEHGRIIVKFHWDRREQQDDKSSCPVRVSQTWAGAGFGGIFLPRVGHEVLVQFLEGDPDRPMVVGCVYNGSNPNPHGLPATKTKSSFKTKSSPGGGGENEFSFEDKKGGEQVYLHAQKDFAEAVENDHSTTVGGNQTVTVKKNQTIHVDGHQTISVSGSGSSGSKDKQGKEIKGSALNVTGNATVDASEEMTITAPKSITLKCGETSITITPDTITLSASGGGQVILNTNAWMHGGDAHVDGKATAEITAPSVSVTGSTVAIGDKTINIGGSEVNISGTKVNSAAMGIHQISGAVVKIN